MTRTLHDAVVAALDRVIDPCSVGRGVPAGLNDMGMVKAVEVDAEAGTAAVTLQLTSPACHFQLWFFERVREEVAAVAGVADCTVEFSKDYDWSDDAMSSDLKARLRDRRRLTLTPRSPATG
jgi:metal-sulfur cluster biosynthetic enzyme